MSNPLLDALFDVEGRPLDPIPFDRITAEHIEPAISELTQKARAAIDAIAADTSPPTYDNTLGALERATEGLETAGAIAEHLESSATSAEIREAWGRAQPDLSRFGSELPLHAPLYKRLRALVDSPATRDLTPTERRHLDKTLEEFRRHGADLDDGKKAALTKVDVELAKLTTKFAQNALDATNAFELVVDDEGRLAGLPASAKDAARASAAEKGHPQGTFRFTLQAPSIIPALTYLDDDKLRETLYRAYNERASKGDLDSREIIRDIVRLRRRRAQILGFPTFADLVVADRMAKSADGIRRFVTDLRDKTTDAFAREKAELETFAKKKLRAWDVGYFSEKQRRERYDFDEEAVRPYFPLERVLTGMFGIFADLYDAKFVPIEAPVWHPSVRPYELTIAGEKVARVYVDLFPRDNKVQGAWMVPLRSGTPGRLHAAVVSANFTPALGDKPALLSHREVQTLFHEFGHLMHQCLSRVSVRRLGGTSVAWDFVELPSQIHENWVWEREAIDRIAAHHETGAKLPDDVFDAMRRARTYRAASAQMQQLGYAEIDLELHTGFDPDRDNEDVFSLARRILTPYVTAELPPTFAMIATFGHLFANAIGYAAGYYSYKWAEVLDADAFARFAREGLLSREVGKAFADQILSKGNSEPPEDLFRAFVGRDPDVTALLTRQGLIEAPPPAE